MTDSRLGDVLEEFERIAKMIENECPRGTEMIRDIINGELDRDPTLYWKMPDPGTFTLKLPRLAGGGRSLTVLLNVNGDRLSERVLVLDCTELRTGSPQFAHQLVEDALVTYGMDSIWVQNPPKEFMRLLLVCASNLQVEDRIVEVPK